MANPESQKVKEALHEIDPKQAGNISALMDAVSEDLLKRPKTPAVISARSVLDEAKKNVLRAKTKKALEDLQIRLDDISASFNMTSSAPQAPAAQSTIDNPPVEINQSLPQETSEIGDKFTSLEHTLDELVKMAGDKEHPLSKEDFAYALGAILSDVAINYEPGPGTVLPTNPQFYEKLAVLVKQRMDQEKNDSNQQAQGKLVLAELYSRLDKIERAVRFSVGRQIGVEVEYRAKGLASKAPELETSYRTLGSITRIDIFHQRLLLSNGKWYTFNELDRPRSHYVFMDRGKEPISTRSTDEYVGKHTREVEKLTTDASAITFRGQLKELNKTVKVFPNHIPAESVLHSSGLRKYYSISEKGDLTVFDNVPIADLQFIYLAFLKQFEVERMIDVENEFEQLAKKPEALKKDPYLRAKVLIVRAQRETFSGESHKGLVTCVKFLEEIKSVESGVPNAGNPGDEIREGVAFARTTLKNHSLERLARLNEIASIVFGQDPDYRKNYFEPLAASLKKETERLAVSDDFVIDSAGLLNVAYFADTEKNKKEEEAILDSASLAVPDSVPLAHLGHRLAKRNMNPGRKSIDLWKRAVALETSADFESLADDSKRKSLYADIGEAYRKGSKNPFTDEHFPAIARVYYQDAVSPEIEYQRFLLRGEKEKWFARFTESENYRKLQQTAAEQASKLLKENSDELKAALVPSQMGEAEFEAVKNQMASSQAVIDALAEAMVQKQVNDLADNKMLEELHNRKKSGDYSGLNASIIGSLTRMEGTGWHISDETLRTLTKQLLITAIIVAASAGVGLLVEGAVGIVLANSLRVAGLNARIAGGIRTGSVLARAKEIGMRTIPYSGRLLGFTASENLMSASIGQKELSWGTFGKDLGLNLMMFMAADAGGFLWERIAGKSLYAQTVGRKVLFNPAFGQQTIRSPQYMAASRAMRGVRWTANAAGSLGVEATIFTGLGVGQEMILSGRSWSEINIGHEFGMNLLTLTALRGGSMLFKPVMEPSYKALETARVRSVERTSPDIFLSNSGLAGWGSRNPQEVIREHHAFADEFGMGKDFFRGKTPQEASKVMAEVRTRIGRGEKLKVEDWNKLAADDPLTCQILLINTPRTDLKLSLAEIETIVGTWRAKGAHPSPEVMIGLVNLLRKDISSVGSAKILRQVANALIATGQNFWAERGRRLLTLRSGTVTAGLAVLMLSSTGCVNIPSSVAVAVGVPTLAGIFGGLVWALATLPVIGVGWWTWHRWSKGKPVLSSVSSVENAKKEATKPEGIQGSIRATLEDVATVVGGRDTAEIARLRHDRDVAEMGVSDLKIEIADLEGQMQSNPAGTRHLTAIYQTKNARLAEAEKRFTAAQEALHKAEHTPQLTPDATKALENIIREYDIAIKKFGHADEITALSEAFNLYTRALRTYYTDPANATNIATAIAATTAPAAPPPPASPAPPVGRGSKALNYAARVGGTLFHPIPQTPNLPPTIGSITILQNNVLAELGRLQQSSRFRRSHGNRALQFAVIGALGLGAFLGFTAISRLVDTVSPLDEGELAEAKVDEVKEQAKKLAKDFDENNEFAGMDRAFLAANNRTKVKHALQIAIIKYITGSTIVMNNEIFKENGMPIDALNIYYKEVVRKIEKNGKEIPGTNVPYSSFLATTFSIPELNMKRGSVLLSNKGTGELAETWADPDMIIDRRVKILPSEE